MKKYLIAGLLLAFVNGFAQTPDNTAAIRLGQPAPAFKTGRWIQGKPVTQLEKGKIYVIEFWATWCGYCIKAMPHLSELSKQYAGKVEFIGVDVLEKISGEQKVSVAAKDLVEKAMKGSLKGKMAYKVCLDTDDKYMEKNWLTAENLIGMGTGIPFTILIDKGGDVAWIGHPYLDGAMEKALGEMMNGTYNLSAFINQVAEGQEQRKKMAARQEMQRNGKDTTAVLQPMNKAYAAKDYEGVIKEAYRAIAQDAAMTRATIFPRLTAFKALLAENPESAFNLLALEQQRIATSKDTAHLFLMDIAAMMGQQPGLDKKYYGFAVNVLQPVMQHQVPAMRLLKGLAMAYYYDGETGQGVAVLQKEVNRMKLQGVASPELEQLITHLKAHKL